MGSRHVFVRRERRWPNEASDLGQRRGGVAGGTYRKIEAKPSQKNELLHLLSHVLWKRAVLKGLEIDERFRNFNGMKFQYELLRYLMMDGE